MTVELFQRRKFGGVVSVAAEAPLFDDPSISFGDTAAVFNGWGSAAKILAVWRREAPANVAEQLAEVHLGSIAGWRRSFDAMRAGAVIADAMTDRGFRRSELSSFLSADMALSIAGLHDTREEARNQIVNAHIRAVLANELVQVASSDTHTVKPWLAQRVPFSPDVRDYKGQGFPLIGGRVERLMNRPAAALVYGRRKHLISVFVLPADQAATLATRSESWRGYHVATWRDAHFAYFATSDLNRPEFDEFVALASLSGR